MPDDATKRCAECGEIKPLSEFHRRSKSPDGRAYKCKQCAISCERRRTGENRGVILARRRERYQERRDILLGRGQAYREDHREALAAQERERRAQLKERILAHYGTTCACCGTTDRLTIDHVNGDGARHREELFGDSQGGGFGQFYAWLARQGFPAGFQTLCHPCNSSKRSGDKCRIKH